MYQYSSEARDKLRSQIAITSVAQCVEELVANCLDAHATKISVVTDLSKPNVRVTDNGFGFTKKNLASAGLRYNTSKNEQKHQFHYGFRGEALNSIAQLSSKLTISSICKGKTKLYVKTITSFGQTHSEVTTDESSTNTQHGSMVYVQGLFAQSPLRLECASQSCCVGDIRQRIVNLIFPHCGVSIIVSDKIEGVIVEIKRSKSFLFRFREMTCGTYPTSQLQCVDLTNGEVAGFAYFGSRKHTDKSLQRFYVNKKLVENPKINVALHEIMSSKDTSQCEDTTHTRQKLFDVYVIFLQCPPSWYDLSLEPERTLIEFVRWKNVFKILSTKFKSIQKKTCETKDFQKPKVDEVSDEDISRGHQMFDSAVDMVCTMSKRVCAPSNEGSGNFTTKRKHGSCTGTPAGSDVSISGKQISLSPPKQLLRKGFVERYDRKLGKTIFVNSTTGQVELVKPTLCAKREFHNRTKLVDKTKKQHFFLTHDYETFLPREKKAMSLSESNLGKEKSLKETLKKYQQIEQEVMFQAPKEVKLLKTIEMEASSFALKISRECLKTVLVIGQVENKFIACRLKVDDDKETLVLFDQHAAHERVRLERFVEESYETTEHGRRVASCELRKQLTIESTPHQRQVLARHKKALERIGIKLTVEDDVVRIIRVPRILSVKGSADMTESSTELLQKLVADCCQVLSSGRTLGVTLPPAMFDFLCSKACHGAIRFGDPLTHLQCTELLSSLSKCKLPFQCAHGRPTIFPMLDLSQVASVKTEQFEASKLARKCNAVS